MGFAMGTFAQQDLFLLEDYQTEDDLLSYGSIPDEQMWSDDNQQDFDFIVDYQILGGLFGRGSTPKQQMRGWSDDGFLFFPGHASLGNWNSDPDGWTDYPPDPEVPLGGGVLLLIGFGAAYAMKKRKKED